MHYNFLTISHKKHLGYITLVHTKLFWGMCLTRVAETFVIFSLQVLGRNSIFWWWRGSRCWTDWTISFAYFSSNSKKNAIEIILKWFWKNSRKKSKRVPKEFQKNSQRESKKSFPNDLRSHLIFSKFLKKNPKYFNFYDILTYEMSTV